MKNFIDILRFEFRIFFKDSANILIIYIAAVLYAFLYGSLYGPEVVKDMPIAVVDADRTVTAHEFIRAIDATSNLDVKEVALSMEDAQNMLMERKISGIVNIPKGFEANSVSGGQTHIGLYADGGYFLLYSALLSGVSSVVGDFSHNIQVKTLVASGIPEQRAQVISKPINFSIQNFYNPSAGYATAVMPTVLLIIIQQTLLMVIGMGIGTMNEFKLWKRFRNQKVITMLLAKISAFIVIIIPSVIFLLWIAYKIYGYPMRENTMDLITLLVPFVLGCICLGITLGAFFNNREASMLYLAPLSVFFVLWSGVSWPKECMPGWFYGLGKILPTSSMSEAMVALRTCGTSLIDVSKFYMTLWMLAGTYIVTAYFSLRKCLKKSLS